MENLNLRTAFVPILISFCSLFSLQLYTHYAENETSRSSNEVDSFKVENKELYACVLDCQKTFEARRDATLEQMRGKIADCIKFDPENADWVERCKNEAEAAYQPTLDKIEQEYWDCDCDCMIQFNKGIGCQNQK